KSDAEGTSNFPLGPGEVYATTGGRFCATNTSVTTYIAFAYKLSNQQRQSLVSAVPGWVNNDRFDIDAKGPANATKDQTRLMMQALLADRFKLAIRREKRESQAFALVFVKSGRFGPQLRPHSDDGTCNASSAAPASSNAKPAAPSSTSGLQLPPITC